MNSVERLQQTAERVTDPQDRQAVELLLFLLTHAHRVPEPQEGDQPATPPSPPEDGHVEPTE